MEEPVWKPLLTSKDGASQGHEGGPTPSGTGQARCQWVQWAQAWLCIGSRLSRGSWGVLTEILLFQVAVQAAGALLSVASPPQAVRDIFSLLPSLCP